MGKPEESLIGSVRRRLKILLDQAVTGDSPNAIHGIGKDRDGRVELVTRLAYIAGINRSIEIIDEEVMKGEQHGDEKTGNT